MLIVTIAALVMAASLGWFAYRLLQEEQRRSDARVALLTAALDADAPLPWVPPGQPSHGGLVAPRPALAPVPAAVSARVEAPAVPDVIYLDDARAGRGFRSERDGWPAPASASAHEEDLDTLTRSSGLFADVPEARRGDARGAIAVAGVVLVGLLALGYVWFGRPSPAPGPAATSATTAEAATAPTGGGMPLELLSLSHDQRNGQIVVRGLVRNPVSGSERAGLVASVMLLDQAGGFLGSSRAPLETTRLRPGDDVGFAVELPAHKDVRRYRVTFRGPDGGLVAHADRRGARP